MSGHVCVASIGDSSEHEYSHVCSPSIGAGSENELLKQAITLTTLPARKGVEVEEWAHMVDITRAVPDFHDKVPVLAKEVSGRSGNEAHVLELTFYILHRMVYDCYTVYAANGIQSRNGISYAVILASAPPLPSHTFSDVPLSCSPSNCIIRQT